MIYFDSGALVKRYIEEEGSKEVNKLLHGSEKAVTSRLAYPEILSAIIRRHRAGDIATADCERIKREFRVEWGRYIIIEVHSELFSIIDKLIEKHALRGADSIHLSTALWLQQITKQDVLFAASDADLLKAAKAEKMKIYNPQEYE